MERNSRSPTSTTVQLSSVNGTICFNDVLLNTADLPGETRWEFKNVPVKFYDKIMLGLPSQDEQIERDKIFYVHFRDVEGYVPKFAESFVNEGNCDMFDVMKTLKEVGFTGFMIPDQVPHVVDDTAWGHRGRAYTIGYMTTFLEMLNSGS